jgi:hypothetical protein
MVVLPRAPVVRESDEKPLYGRLGRSLVVELLPRNHPQDEVLAWREDWGPLSPALAD